MVVSQVSANERQTFITLFIIYHFVISQAGCADDLENYFQVLNGVLKVRE